MANSSHIPSGNLRELRPGLVPDPASIHLRAILADSPVRGLEAAADPVMLPGSQDGPRKLVRPKLPPGTSRGRLLSQRGESPILAHQMATRMAPRDHASTNAEAFYFQKQVQTQMLMVFVLEDGEQVEGYIEWYDTNVVKVRNGGRTLIYKSAIKYLYKAGENSENAGTLNHAR